MKIQGKEKPEPDNIFVNFEAFHVKMAFFYPIWKFIDSLWIDKVLVHLHVIAVGLMKSFLDSKHQSLQALTSANGHCIKIIAFRTIEERLQRMHFLIKQHLNGALKLPDFVG